MKNISVTCICILLCLTANAQVPQGFNYQAIARNASGVAISNTNIKVEISIYSDTIANTLVWREEHEKTTNEYGLFTLTVGEGIRTGGTAASFNVIDWTESPKMFIGVGIKNPATAASFTPMGKARLWSVPYAMVAGDASTPFILTADDAADDPLFEVRRKDGQPVFSVYNNAVTINISNDQPQPGKGSPQRGGFAVGGFDEAKGITTDLFRITDDSVRMYIRNYKPVKGSPQRGGFAIGGFDEVKSTIITNYMRLTPENYFIGENSGISNTTGVHNSFMGYEAGRNNTEGTGNMFIGPLSGYSNLTGNHNVMMGDYSGYFNTEGSDNVFVGSFAGYKNTIGGSNIFIGHSAGQENKIGNLNIFIGRNAGIWSTGMRNTFIGPFAGENNTTGEDNIFIGDQAGQGSTTGKDNVFVGTVAGWQNEAGNQNTFVGSFSGSNIKSGSCNVFLGSYAGMGQSGQNNVIIGYQAGGWNNTSGNIMIGYNAGINESNSNRLIIHNTSGGENSALIYGEFDTQRLNLNAAVTVRDMLRITPRSTPPFGPAQEGDVYYDSTDHKLKVWNGEAWMACW